MEDIGTGTESVNPILANVPILYPQKTTEILYFQEVESEIIG